ncbi:hypothetical protein ABK905_11140 [Acerihabitans sp. KWT182]|uniref:Uncharacterized protein n=1 Tax=Acerihabitans sp. KWT182 TaxID=3157919 RepID=A0AAU7QH00_9GAMM
MDINRISKAAALFISSLVISPLVISPLIISSVVIFTRVIFLLVIFPLALFGGRCFAEASVPTAQADSFSDWLSEGSLYGEAKTMTFFQEYGSSEMSNRRTHSFGGDIQYQSPAFQGFSFGLAGYGAYNLGLNPSDTAQVEPYLPSDNVTVLGKAYLRYQGYGLDLKAGRMNLDTPFANSGQGWTMIPALYQGYGGSYSLPVNPDVKFYGYRIYRFKPFSSDTFGRGDTGSPEITDTTIPSVDSDGFTTLGLRYGQLYHAKAEAWYYHFDKRAQLAFAGAEIPVQSLQVGSWTPYWGGRSMSMNGIRPIRCFLMRISIPACIPPESGRARAAMMSISSPPRCRSGTALF